MVSIFICDITRYRLSTVYRYRHIYIYILLVRRLIFSSNKLHIVRVCAMYMKHIVLCPTVKPNARLLQYNNLGRKGSTNHPYKIALQLLILLLLLFGMAVRRDLAN
jgi:hypothetical protein